MFPDRRSIAGGLVAVLAAASLLGAQALDRGARPTPGPAKEFRFPAVQSQTLSNGLRVVVAENHALPLVAVRVILPVDSSADPVGKEGLYDVMLSMLREGTTSLNGDQFAAAIGALGSDISLVSTRASQPFGGFTTITSNVDRSFELLADMLMHPSFPEDAVERRKAAQVAAVQRALQSPSTLPRQLFYTLTYGADHPLTRSTKATEASVRSITRDDVKGFHETFFRPENITLVIAGDLSPSDAMRIIARRFGSWKRVGPAYQPRVIDALQPAPTTIYLFDRPTVAQTYAFVGRLGPDRSSPDYYAIEALGPVLGTTSASRMALNLRERRSYYYSGTLWTPVWRPAGERALMWGSAALNTQKIDSALFEWTSELEAIRGSRPPTDAEMKLVRVALTGTLPSQTETIDRLADRVAALTRNGMPYDYDAKLTPRIFALTSADLSAAARRHLDTSRMVIVVVGDRKVVEPLLRAAKIAPVVIVDANGRPVP